MFNYNDDEYLSGWVLPEPVPVPVLATTPELDPVEYMAEGSGMYLERKVVEAPSVEKMLSRIRNKIKGRGLVQI